MGTILIKSFEALWQVLVVGIILGAGLPALFALGIRALSTGRTVAADGVSYSTPPKTRGRVGSTVLFGICVAAVLFGIVVIIFGAQIFGK